MSNKKSKRTTQPVQPTSHFWTVNFINLQPPFTCDTIRSRSCTPTHTHFERHSTIVTLRIVVRYENTNTLLVTKHKETVQTKRSNKPRPRDSRHESTARTSRGLEVQRGARSNQFPGQVSSDRPPGSIFQ